MDRARGVVLGGEIGLLALDLGSVEEVNALDRRDGLDFERIGLEEERPIARRDAIGLAQRIDDLGAGMAELSGDLAFLEDRLESRQALGQIAIHVRPRAWVAVPRSSLVRGG